MNHSASPVRYAHCPPGSVGARLMADDRPGRVRKPKPTLLASSSSLDGIRAAATRYYCGSNVTLFEQPDGTWAVHTGNGKRSTMVELKRGRYRLILPIGGAQ